MTEYSRFFDSATYTEAQFGEFMKRIMRTDGIVQAAAGYLIVSQSTPAAMTVSVAAGEAWIQGAWYQNSAAKAMTIEAAHATLPRWDRIVLRLSWSGNSAVLTVLKGTAAATPSVPSLTQTSATWDLPLASVYVPAAVTAIYTFAPTNGSYIYDDRVPAACNLGEMYVGSDGSLYAGANYIHDVVDPVANQDAATKAYADTKAPLASPALTGTPTAPTAASGTNTTQIATTAFIQSALAAWSAFSPTLSWAGSTPAGITTTARRVITGKMVFFTIAISHGTAGGLTTGLSITGLPGTIAGTTTRVPLTSYRDIAGSMSAAVCYLNATSSTITFHNYLATSAVGAIYIEGFYEVT